MDDHLEQLMIKHGLQRSGFNVWMASTASEATKLYRHYREGIGVVLIDADLPKRAASAVLDKLRQINPARKACCIANEVNRDHLRALRHSHEALFITFRLQMNELAYVLRLAMQGISTELRPADVTRQTETYLEQGTQPSETSFTKE